MSIGERDRFLRAFASSAARGESLTAFCVLGGIFSEGIDLRGESLIGSIIVGIGLPGLSSQLNILAEYYDKTRESGRDYAYLYPAMNKILQAAGRVIRTEGDEGIILLLDERFDQQRYYQLYPPDWFPVSRVSPANLPGELEAFWKRDEK
jgi:Rad3-related DNA helicase